MRHDRSIRNLALAAIFLIAGFLAVQTLHLEPLAPITRQAVLEDGAACGLCAIAATHAVVNAPVVPVPCAVSSHIEPAATPFLACYFFPFDCGRAPPLAV